MTSEVYDATKIVLTQKILERIFLFPFSLFYSCYGHPLHHICIIAGFAGTNLLVEIGTFSQGGGGGGGIHSLQWYYSKLKIPYLIQCL